MTFYFQPLSQFEANLYTNKVFILYPYNFFDYMFCLYNQILDVLDNLPFIFAYLPFHIISHLVFSVYFVCSSDLFNIFSIQAKDISHTLLSYYFIQVSSEIFLPGLISELSLNEIFHLKYVVLNINRQDSSFFKFLLLYWIYVVNFLYSVCIFNLIIIILYVVLVESYILHYLQKKFFFSEYYTTICDQSLNDIIWFDTSINKFHLTTFFILVYFLLFFVFCFKNLKYYVRSWNLLVFNMLDDFLSNTILQQLGVKRGQKYSVILKSFFFLILFSNIFGLIPFSFTITSHLIYTFAFSLSILVGITILGFYIQGFSFLKLLVPGGAPVFLLPLLIPIEFISYIARCFSLAIRLFANMMSGHTLLNILSSFVIKINNNGFILLSLAPLFVVIAVFLLEVGIAFLQAYVFLVLVCIYLKDAFEAGH
jgi:ATP synthase subunit 6